MERRRFLTHIAAAAACLCPLCRPRPGLAAEGPHWTYEGEDGPSGWAKLSKDYGVCGNGREQSPINLEGPVPAMLPRPMVAWQPQPLEVKNNGHTIVVPCPQSSSLSLEGKVYALQQFHFHHPSEHTVDGVTYDLEAHFVHQSATGDLAVLGVLIARGAANPALESIWRVMPEKAGDSARGEAPFQPAALLPPSDGTSYRYAGSLTTPPCSETVSWVVYRQPIYASPEQIERFARIFRNNARPPQPLNRRKLLLDML